MVSEPDEGCESELEDSLARALAESKSAEELLPLVYERLRGLARVQIQRERPGQTLQPTALVHEAFLNLASSNPAGWEGERHFFVAAAESMRRILIDQARRKQRLKHGGGRARESVDELEPMIEEPNDRMLEVDEALQELERTDARAREIVNLRYFTGLTTTETAQALGISASTVEREWRFIRAFLGDALGDSVLGA